MTTSWVSTMPEHNSDFLRLGDAEREQASALLRDHYAEGRLDTEEYSERLDAVWAARTRADLRPVFADLPGRPGDPEHSYLGLMRFDFVTMIDNLGGDARALRAFDVADVAVDQAEYPQ